MKLSHKPERNRKPRGVDLVRRPEIQHKSDFFDPRIDLDQVELESYVHLTSGGPDDYEQKRRIYATDWVGWIRPEHMNAIQNLPHLREFWVNHFFDNLRDSRHFHGRFSDNIREVANLFQTFPEARSEVHFSAQEFKRAMQDLVLRLPSSPTFLFYTVSSFVQVWPERREEIVRTIFGSGELGFNQLKTRISNSSHWPGVVNDAAYLVALFPEYKEQVISLLVPYKSDIFRNLRTLKTKSEKIVGFEEYQHMIKYLTILGSDSVCIDEKGTLQVVVRSGKIESQLIMPDRLL